jgi:apolipoprotein N-acyltransferase
MLWWMLDPFDIVSVVPALKYMSLFFLCGMFALFAGLAEALSKRARPSDFWIAYPVAFTVLYWFKGSVWPGIPFGDVATLWSWCLPVLQIVSLVGMFGLTFLTVFMASALWHRKWIPAGLTAAFVLSFGFARLDNSDFALDYNIRMVNTGIKGQGHYNDAFAKLAAFSHAAGAEDVDLFAWPETAFGVELDENPALAAAVAGVNSDASFLVVGFNRFEGGGDDWTVRNSLGVFTEGGLAEVYDKVNLVPFGEYVPRWLPLDVFMDKSRFYTPGEARPLLDLGAALAYPTICYEIVFSALRVPSAADFILNISNESWIPPRGRAQHFDFAVIRAIEEGVPVVRSVNDGISGVISPFGRTLAVMGRAGVLDAALPERLARTPFSYTGNWLLVPVLLACFAALMIRARRGQAK